jgi:diacylglycerol kinase family enzyme
MGDPTLFRHLMEDIFAQGGWTFTLYETTGNEVVRDVVRANLDSHPDMVVACGGDGTISQVASGLVGSDIPLGAVPLGTWNALARNMDIPFVPEDALRLLTGPHAFLELDGLEVNGNIYLINVGCGFSASMIGSTDRAAKRRFGFLAYIWNLILQLIGLRRIGFHLIIDQKHRKLRSAEVMVVNSGLLGLRELPTRLNIYPNDGRAEVCIFKPRSILSMPAVAWNILVIGKNRHPEFRFFTSESSVTIKTKKPMHVQGDGELIGKTPVEIRIVKHAVRLIVPEKLPFLKSSEIGKSVRQQ